MMKEGTISIVTTVYNDFPGLLKTVESLMSQKNRDWIHILVDSNSTDIPNGWTYLKNKNVHHIIQKCGIYEGMNIGIENVQSDYFMILNAGTTFCDEHVIQRMQDNINEYAESAIFIYPCEKDDKGFYQTTRGSRLSQLFYPHGIQHEACLYRTNCKILHDPVRFGYSADSQFVAKYLHYGPIANFNHCKPSIRYGRGGASDKASFWDKAMNNFSVARWLLRRKRYFPATWFINRGLRDLYRLVVPVKK